MKKKLILLTNHFPYGKGEEFLETEIKYLSSYFDEIFIIVNNPKDNLTREIPNNINVIPVKYRKNPIFNISSLKLLTNNIFWGELETINKTYNLKLNYSILKRLISTMHFGNKIKDKIYEVIKLNNLDVRKTVIYSYWWNTNAYAASVLKKENKEITAISRAHRADLYLEKNSLNYLPLKKFMINNLDKLFLISSHGFNYLKEKYKFMENKKLEVSRLGINNGYNFSKISKGDTFKLISCSYISKVKRINLIIDSLANIKKTKINWTHIGDGKKFEEMKKYANEKLKEKENMIPTQKAYNIFQFIKI